MITHARLGYDDELQVAILVGENGTRGFRTYGPEAIGYLWMARFHVKYRAFRSGEAEETTIRWYLRRSCGLRSEYRHLYPKFTQDGVWHITLSPKEDMNEH